ncbi:hypothetical protein Agub_g2135, partial [Astrephomene gubernaculifera]
DMRQQLLKLLISGSLHSGIFESALSYIEEYGSVRAPPCTADVAVPPARLPLDVLLLGLQAHMGLGRAAEAAAVLVRDMEPQPGCSPAVVKAALSNLLPAPLEQLSSALPAITACLLACLARCRRAEEAGSRAAAAAAAWPPTAGAELVLMVATAVASHEGPTAEGHLLNLLAHDDVVAAICHATDPRDRLHRLLYARATAAYHQADHASSARLFAAALLYASGGGGAPYCRTARMLSNCYAAMGQPRRALGYLDLAAAHEPHTVTHLLLRLRLLLSLQEAAEQGHAAGTQAAVSLALGVGGAAGRGME